jgi:hypothetical protein
MSYARGMRWERFFDDLEDQLASEWEAERAALDTEAERLRLSRVSLRERLLMLAERERGVTAPTFDFTDGGTLAAEVTGVGADWVALDAPSQPRAAVIAPFTGIAGVGMPHADLLRSARPAPARSPLAERLTFGFALRDLVRRRSPVMVHLSNGRALSGTIDRAGADHFDLAVHEQGAPRRAEAVSGYRIIAFAAVSRIRVDGRPPVL